jgi:hypothetical protein
MQYATPDDMRNFTGAYEMEGPLHGWYPQFQDASVMNNPDLVAAAMESLPWLDMIGGGAETNTIPQAQQGFSPVERGSLHNQIPEETQGGLGLWDILQGILGSQPVVGPMMNSDQLQNILGILSAWYESQGPKYEQFAASPVPLTPEDIAQLISTLGIQTDDPLMMAPGVTQPGKVMKGASQFLDDDVLEGMRNIGKIAPPIRARPEVLQQQHRFAEFNKYADPEKLARQERAIQKRRGLRSDEISTTSEGIETADWPIVGQKFSEGEMDEILRRQQPSSLLGPNVGAGIGRMMDPRTYEAIIDALAGGIGETARKVLLSPQVSKTLFTNPVMKTPSNIGSRAADTASDFVTKQMTRPDISRGVWNPYQRSVTDPLPSFSKGTKKVYQKTKGTMGKDIWRAAQRLADHPDFQNYLLATMGTGLGTKLIADMAGSLFQKMATQDIEGSHLKPLIGASYKQEADLAERAMERKAFRERLKRERPVPKGHNTWGDYQRRMGMRDIAQTGPGRAMFPDSSRDPFRGTAPLAEAVQYRQSTQESPMSWENILEQMPRILGGLLGL